MKKNKKGGFVVTVELLFIVTLLVIGVAIAFPLIRNSVIAEIEDTAEAIGALDQSYFITGADVWSASQAAEITGSHEGSQFTDDNDQQAGAGDDALSYNLLIAPDASAAGLGENITVQMNP
jgi:hypothetical protein